MDVKKAKETKETKKTLEANIKRKLKRSSKGALKLADQMLELDRIATSREDFKQVFGSGDYKGFSINGKKYKLGDKKQ